MTFDIAQIHCVLVKINQLLMKFQTSIQDLPEFKLLNLLENCEYVLKNCMKVDSGISIRNVTHTKRAKLMQTKIGLTEQKITQIIGDKFLSTAKKC